MHDCPHCHKPGITTLRRLTLGPALPATCRQCGGKVGVSYRQSALAASPFFASLLVAMSIESIWLALLLLIVGSTVMFVLWFRLVPLERRP